jgi:hypothetical protein
MRGASQATKRRKLLLLLLWLLYLSQGLLSGLCAKYTVQERDGCE